MAQIPVTGKEVRLVSYPQGQVRVDNFEVVETPVPPLQEGQALVRNEFMSLGTVYLDQMKPDTDLPIPVFALGGPMWGRTIGRVLASTSPDLAEGDLVEHFSGWREYATGYAAQFSKRDASLFPSPEYFLSNGPTAWRGMVDVADVHEGDVVFVSAASSGVGCLAGQIAKARGARTVIGSTGSPEKIDFLLKEAGYDAVFDYHDAPVADRLRELAPEGISVYFDNVGGEQFEAAVQVAAPGARFALCGSLPSQHGLDARPRLDLPSVFPRELSFKGFATYHTPEQINGWNDQFSTWLGEERISYPRTVAEGGVAALPQAVVDHLTGRFAGTALVSLT